MHAEEKVHVINNKDNSSYGSWNYGNSNVIIFSDIPSFSNIAYMKISIKSLQKYYKPEYHKIF